MIRCPWCLRGGLIGWGFSYYGGGGYLRHPTNPIIVCRKCGHDFRKASAYQGSASQEDES